MHPSALPCPSVSAPARAGRVAGLCAAALLAACGGGGSDATGTAASAPAAASATAPSVTAQADTAAPLPAMESLQASSGSSVPQAQRIAAATATARSGSNPCQPIRPFYWEVGDQRQALAGGSVDGDAPARNPAYAATTIMSIASASKWIYAAYVAQKRGGVLNDMDVKFLGFHSGYTAFDSCLPGQSIDVCLAYGHNGDYRPATDGPFYYNGGHMEKHASLIGLGALDAAGLGAEVRGQLGRDLPFAYSQAQPAGGVVTTADAYARFLRKLLAGELQLAGLLGSHPSCTNPTTCAPGEALYTPVPSSESWHYSLGHWVEDDPAVGDGAFSSAGAFGFYPWIDAGKTWYGVLARRTDAEGTGYASAQCGRLIRKAWATGVAQ